jgi:putative membrane protein
MEDGASRSFFKQAIPLYAKALNRHLLKETTQFQLDELPHPDMPDFSNTHHLPNMLAGSMFSKVQQLYNQGILSSEQLLYINTELQSFTDVCGACERIKNTPIPFSYSTFIKKFIFIYVLTIPFGFAFTLGIYTIPVTTFLFYVLASLELIAEEIEDPFGSDSNDLPMSKIADNIKGNINEILH